MNLFRPDAFLRHRGMYFRLHLTRQHERILGDDLRRFFRRGREDQ